MHLDYSNIFEYSQIPMEYLFIDSADVDPGKSGSAYTNLSMQDWFFRMHFPGNPVMPGTMMMEAVMELGTLIICALPKKSKMLVQFYACDKVVISGEARPGDQLLIKADLMKYRHGVASFTGQIESKGKEILHMNFTLLVPDEMVKPEPMERKKVE